MDSGRRGDPSTAGRRERRNTALRTCIDRFALPLLPSVSLSLSLSYIYISIPSALPPPQYDDDGRRRETIHSPKLKRRWKKKKISTTFRSLILSCTAGRAVELIVLKFTSAFFRYSKMSPKWLTPPSSLPPMLCQCEITCQQ